ncbi:hypothetical protein AB4Y38_39380 [Paraburkholderia sp. EG285A]|uniref:gp53-like domain-containing protein n=1 Tax=Paraburkholderia sp. EG285A TaxID=3237009 RepID=UPI0034D2478C
MSLASNLAALGRILTAAAGGIVKGTAPAAGDSSTAFITSAWFKGEQAAEATQGTAKVATQAQTTAGTDDATIVTPKKLRAGFAISAGGNGYIAFPSWLGGLIIQWGQVGIATGNADTVTFPLAFPNACIRIVATDVGSGCNSVAATPSSKTTFIAYGKTLISGAYASTSYQYIAFGY